MKIIFSGWSVCDDQETCVRVLTAAGIIDALIAELSDTVLVVMAEFQTDTKFALGWAKRNLDGKLEYLLIGLEKQPGLTQQMASELLQHWIKKLLKELAFEMHIKTGDSLPHPLTQGGNNEQFTALLLAL